MASSKTRLAMDGLFVRSFELEKKNWLKLDIDYTIHIFPIKIDASTCYSIYHASIYLHLSLFGHYFHAAMMIFVN